MSGPPGLARGGNGPLKQRLSKETCPAIQHERTSPGAGHPQILAPGGWRGNGHGESGARAARVRERCPRFSPPGTTPSGLTTLRIARSPCIACTFLGSAGARCVT